MTALVTTSYTIEAVTDIVIDTRTAAESDAELRDRLALLTAKKESAQKRLNHIMLRMSSMSKDLNTRNGELTSEISELQAKIKKLQETVRESVITNAPPPDDLDKEFEDTYQESYGRSSQPDDEPFMSRAEENAEVVRLFRAIALRTHPDKTDDPTLQALFISAKDYRNLGDLQGLRDIIDLLDGKATAFVNRLLLEIEATRQEMNLAQMQLNSLLTSIDFRLLEIYEADRQHVYFVTRNQLLDRIKLLTAQLEMLQRVTGTAPKPPSYLKFVFKF